MAETTAAEEKLQIDPRAMQALTFAAQEHMTLVAQDLFQVAGHGRRVRVGPEDVLFLARRNRLLQDRLRESLERIMPAGGEDEDGASDSCVNPCGRFFEY